MVNSLTNNKLKKMITKIIKAIIDFTISYAWSAWIGFGIGYFFKVGLDDWRWYAFSLPMILLVGISKWKLSSGILKDKESTQHTFGIHHPIISDGPKN